MAKKVTNILVKDTLIPAMQKNGIDYVCITDIARQKNAYEPKGVVKNWMRLKNTIEYVGLWEKLNNPQFKGGGFDPLFQEAGVMVIWSKSILHRSVVKVVIWSFVIWSFSISETRSFAHYI